MVSTFASRLFLCAGGLILLPWWSLQAQTTTTVSIDSPYQVVVATYKAGDTVTITSQINTSDPDEESEGEDLIVTTSTNISQGYQDIGIYSQPFTVSFTASADGAVSAYVSGADGDETGTVTVVTASGCSSTVPTPIPSPPSCPVQNWSPGKKKAAGLTAAASASIGTALTLSSVAGFFCGPAAPACIAAFEFSGWGLTTADAFLGVYAGLDPPDSNYMLIAQPTVPPLTPVVPDSKITPDLAAALNALNTNSYTFLAYTQAAITAQNRTSGAANARDATWEAKQFTAQQNYAQVLESLARAEPVLLANLQAALVAGYPGTITATANDVINEETNVEYYGPPATVTKALSQAGLDSATITLLTNFYIGQDASKAAGTYPAAFTSTALTSAVQTFITTGPPVLSVTASGLTYSRLTQEFSGTITVRNTSSALINGPFSVLFQALSPGVALANASGVSSIGGSPYLTVPNTSLLAPGGTISFTAQFIDPTHAPINFAPTAMTGSVP